VRLPRFAADQGRAGPTAGAAGPGNEGGASHPLFGGWSATRWQYTSAEDPGQTVDVVCDLGGSISLSLTETAFILTCDVAGLGHRSLGGTCVVRGDELLLSAEGTAGFDAVRFRQIGETLSLRSDASGWDFEGKGHDRAASFVAVLVRL
jgi:hypothetical protein